MNLVLRWLLGGLGVASGLALFAPLGWPFELFSHFRLQYVAAALLLVLLLAWRREFAAAAIALLIAGWHAAPGLGTTVAATRPMACHGPGVTVATANLRFSNIRREPFLSWLGRAPADLVVVQEVTAAWAADLEQLRAYPYRHVRTREDPYGIAVLSRWPLESIALVDFARDGLPSFTGVVDADGQKLRFIGLHTHWPVLPALARARDEALRGAAELARTSDLPVVLLGDLNLTPDSPEFAHLVAASGLRDVLRGKGWSPTWLADFWPLALRIDHVLASPGLCVEHAEVGPSLGSDHRPVIARLRAP